jgi:hypothetical protein
MIATGRADGIIGKNYSENKYKTGIFANIEISIPDPYKEGIHWYKISIMVPEKDIEDARRKLKPGRFINLRHIEITGKKREDENILMGLRTRWCDVVVREQ